ncbi:MAG: hypothetical protein K2P48_02185, partial [Lachnospiraceae bacterium]|nr:hypothetical protein [Lachnospiraceae bacterium]
MIINSSDFYLHCHPYRYCESLRLSQHGWPCGPPDGRLSMMVVYYESLRLSQHGWPCGPPAGRLSMMVVYMKVFDF